MRTASRLLFLLLGLLLLCAVSVFYAVQQQRLLRSTRAAAEALERERVELQDRLREAERRNLDAARSLAGSAAGESVPPPAAAEAALAAATSLPAVEPSLSARAGALLDNPEAQRFLALQQRGVLDVRYGALFRMLNLPPDQLEQLKDLLVEKRTATADVLAAARSQGLSNRENRDEIRGLIQSTQEEIDAGIRSLLGEADYARYQFYEQTQPQRAVVSRLDHRLNYSGTPLTPQQGEQLVALFAAASGIRTDPARLPGPAGGALMLSDQTLLQAAGVLTPGQMQALRELQLEQQAQAELSRLIRDSRQLRPGRGGSTPPGG